MLIIFIVIWVRVNKKGVLLKICIDIQAAVAQRAGIGRYTRFLAEHLLKCAGADELSFFHFDFMRRGLTPPLANARANRWCPGRIAQLCWKDLNWPPFDWFAGQADVYHFPNFFIPPLSRGKCVVSIHDASFLRHPEFTESRNLAYLRASIVNTVRKADAIITISHFSAAELGFFFPEARAKTHVIYPGIVEHISKEVQGSQFTVQGYSSVATERDGHLITGPVPAGIREAKGLRKPYVLTVGTLEPRKNLEFLVRVFENMKEFQGELVVVGRRGWKYASILDRIASSSRANEIRLLENVGDDELAAIYAGAELFIFPSLYEGFGFPPLEAAACGAPVLSSPGGSLKEALGDGAMLMPDYDPAKWSEAALLLLNDQPTRQALIDKGRRQAAKYSWTETARQTMALYRSLG
jgi:glycosyltransferase involved in cell wall biosynthesis